MCKSIKGEKKDYISVFIGFSLVAIILIVYAFQLTVPVISDETITMANAAYFDGKNWKYMVAALGGNYYRYFQAFLTIPLFKVLDEPMMIYRCSMILQALFHASIVLVVYLICVRHLKILSVRLAVLLGVAVSLIPASALYALYYRGDLLLTILPWYVLLFLLELLKAAEEGKIIQKRFFTFLVVIFSYMAYMAHTRGIVVYIALVISIIGIQILLKKKTVSWPIFLFSSIGFIILDLVIAQNMKDILYSVSGANANTLESENVANMFYISFTAVKDMLMLSISWLNTILCTTQGLVLIGISIFLGIFWNKVRKRSSKISIEEKVILLYAFLVFVGYYAVGVLFFKWTYIAFRTGKITKRVDRLLYDRYAICGVGLIIFLALYAICYRKEWLQKREKSISIITALGTFGIFLWKILPIAKKCTGYVYNTIILNTFQTIENPACILSGEEYEGNGLIKICLLGLLLMIVVLGMSFFKKKWMTYSILGLVIISDLLLIHVNFIKIRKASNDYVLEATQDIVQFMQELEDDITLEYPYVLKGGLSGIKIQFYQSQLMDYKMFGKDQEEMLDLDNYFIISANENIETTWYEEDYYLFEDFDYENAAYDIVYVKGEELMKKLEALGYEMYPYEMPADVQEQ